MPAALPTSDAGVAIWLYRAPTVLHSKHFTIDDDMDLFGLAIRYFMCKCLRRDAASTRHYKSECAVFHG